MPPQSSQLPRIKRTNALGLSWSTLLVYSVPRWGKTRLTRTAKKPLVVACEMGDRRGLGTLSDIDIPFVPCDTMEELLATARALSQDREIATFEGEQFETIILDSGSVAGELGLDSAKATFGYGDYLWDATKGSGKDPRKAYPYMNEKMRQLMKIFFSCQAHFIVIARESVAEEVDTEGKSIRYKVPEFPGQKLPYELPGWPDGTLRGDVVNGQRLLRTRTHMRAVAGIRAPDNVPVPEFIVPNTADICEWMRTWDPAILKRLTPAPPKPINAPVVAKKKEVPVASAS